MNIWSQLKHFKRSENWGAPSKVDPKLLLILDAYRDELGIPLYVSRAVGYGDKNSAHYPDPLCQAVDLIPFLSEKSSITLCDCYFLATKFPFSGIGIYPYWQLSRRGAKADIIEKGGLHLDCSTSRALPPFRAAGHWVGVPGEKYTQKYYGVSLWNLKRFCIV